MPRRVLKRALRTDAIAAVVVVVALLGALVASLVILNRHGEQQESGRPELRFSEDVQKQLEAELEKVMADGAAPGAIVGIWVNGKGSWVQARGVSDVRNNTPVSTADHVRIASVTKTFVATAVLQLVDSKKLSLDDTVARFVPRVPNGETITVRQLLNHTSGLFDFIYDPVFQAACGADPLENWKPEQLLSSSILHEPYFAPGQGFHYSNTNYVVLGMIVEKVTGRKISREIEQKILKPLGLDDTSFPSSAILPDPSSRGYVEKYGKLTDVTDMHPSMGWASSGMVSDLDDLRRWAEALANGGFISEESERERMNFVSSDKPNVQYGLGIMKWGEFLGHEGNAFGFSTAVFYIPSKKTTIVVLLNESDVDYTATHAFVNFAKVLFPGETPPSL